MSLPSETMLTTSMAARSYGETVVRSNREKIVARLKAVRAARAAALELKVSDLNGEPLKDQLAELCASLPDTTLVVK